MPRRPLALALAILAALVVTAALQVVGYRHFFAPGAAAQAERGREVFWGRGRCGSCHAIGGEGGSLRCPDLGGATDGVNLRTRAAGRAPGLDALEYLAQSLLDPDAVVVEGYPRGLMPPVTEPPLSLGDEEVRALVAFLAAADGAVPEAAEVAEAVAHARAGLRRSAAQPVARGDSGTGQVVWDRMGCATCHVIEGITPPEIAETARRRGPDLTGIGAVQSAAYLRQAVWEPEAVVIAGPGGAYLADDGHSTRMPSYRGVMSEDELRHLVAFLATLR